MAPLSSFEGRSSSASSFNASLLRAINGVMPLLPSRSKPLEPIRSPDLNCDLQDMESNPFTVSSQSYNATDHNCALQVTRGEVQERVIKNKTLLTSAEPAAQNLTLQRLLRTLRARVEADKLLLFHDTELRKMAANTSRARLAAMAESSSPSAEAKSGSASQVRTSV